MQVRDRLRAKSVTRDYVAMTDIDAAGIQGADNRETRYHDNADDRVQASLTANILIRG